MKKWTQLELMTCNNMKRVLAEYTKQCEHKFVTCFGAVCIVWTFHQ